LPGIVGIRIGSYEIIELLGKGGMGEVYRARDSKLKRDVAIKMLPEEFARDRDRVSRFQREAELLASLNHTNIAAVYDFLEQDASRFLVLELVEGDTLADRIARGAIQVDDALPIAKQMCDALEAAHARGVVHRDLKPANIKLLPDGTVKVLDFGLAKALDFARKNDQPDVANSPTLSIGGSFAGMILGTAAYMSPEQARGLPVDARSDIFSFGCVLFEMLTGRRAFAGDTLSDILASVLKNEPDLTLLPADLDPRLRLLLQRALAKPVKQRWQAIGDLRYEIEQVLANPTQSASPRRGNERVAWILAGVTALTAAVLGVAWLNARATPDTNATPPLQLSIDLPEGAELAFASGSALAISPDGTRVAYSAVDASGDEALWVRSLSAATSKRIEGTSGGAQMFWSPDSESLAYFSAGKLFRVDVNEGGPRVLADAPNQRGGAWSQQDVILFVPQSPGPLMRMAATGGTPTPLQHTGSMSPYWPVFLPDGNRFLFTTQPGEDHQRRNVVQVGWLDSERIQSLPGIGSRALYSRSGHLLFVEQGSLMSQAFDLASLALTGSAARIVDRVSHSVSTGNATFTVSNSGTLAYRAGAEMNLKQLTWFDRTGQAVGAIGAPDLILNFRMTRDQTRIALDRSDPRTGKREVWVVDDLASGIASRLTGDEGNAMSPIWSPDAKFMLYRSPRKEGSGMRLVDAADGTAEQHLKEHYLGSPDDWSGDGSYVLQGAINDATNFDIGLLPMTGETPRSWFLQTPANEGQAKISPNGRWIAYTSDESGLQEIYVQSFPVPGNKRRISNNGGSWPRWRRDGAELIYVAPGGLVTTVAVSSGERFTAGAPTTLFRSRNGIGGAIGLVDPFEVSLDGQRFLMLVRPPAPTSIPLILNWPALLKQ
jgi:serine/threonine protein kinase/Tol biopolymer transport system component